MTDSTTGGTDNNVRPLKIAKADNRHVIDLLERVLNQAKNGEILGLAVICLHNDSIFSHGITESMLVEGRGFSTLGQLSHLQYVCSSHLSKYANDATKQE